MLEGLHEVVVSTGFEPFYAVVETAERGEEQNGSAIALSACGFHEFQTGHARQHPFDHDGIEHIGRDALKCRTSVSAELDANATRDQRKPNRLSNVGIILHEENAHLCHYRSGLAGHLRWAWKPRKAVDSTGPGSFDRSHASLRIGKAVPAPSGFRPGFVAIDAETLRKGMWPVPGLRWQSRSL